MGRKKSKVPKAKQKKASQNVSATEQSGSRVIGSEKSAPIPIDSSTRSSEKSTEEKRQEMMEKFTELLMSTMEMFNFNGKFSAITAEILMLIYTKNRWCEDPKTLPVSWVKQYNKFGRIDGPGFNYMRRDLRIIYEHAVINRRDATKVVQKFPFQSEQKLKAGPASSMSKSSTRRAKVLRKIAKNRRVTSKQSVKIVSKQNVQSVQSTSQEIARSEEESQEDSADDSEEQMESSDEENESYDLPPSLLTELRRDCIKKSGKRKVVFDIPEFP
uniref:ETS domain-containing protein n=1 Tax=Elaeophora elaphi TaxID=1147741 RepID=A0A0R3S4Y0_9BILA